MSNCLMYMRGREIARHLTLLLVYIPYLDAYKSTSNPLKAKERERETKQNKTKKSRSGQLSGQLA